MPATSKPSSTAQIVKSVADFLIFFGRRLLFGCLVLLAVIYMTFFGLGVSRGMPLGATAWMAVGDTADYLGRLAHWDLGSTYLATQAGRTVPIPERLAVVLPRTLILLAVTLVVAAVLGTWLGSIAARKRSTWLYPVVLFLSLVGVSLPSFFLALLFQIGVIQFSRGFGRSILPVGGYGLDIHLILPSLVLSARPLAQIARVTSIAISDTLGMEHVRVARSKGLAESLVWWRHVVRVSAIPILTTLGTSLRYALISLPVVEFFFGWDGVGSTLLKTLARQDDLMTVALTVTLGLLVVVVNILLDIGYRLLDPRLADVAARANRRFQMSGGIRDAMQDMWQLIGRNKLLRRLLGRPAEDSPALQHLAQQQLGNNSLELDPNAYRRERLKAWLRGTFANGPFLIGALVLVLLLALFVVGPRVAPHNPFVTRGVAYVDGELLVPPFEPGDGFPLGTDMLGRDILSLIITGWQQTLILATTAMLARMALGFVLGALAGWNEGSVLDRLILSLSEMVAALPALLFAMLLILTIGIRKGEWVFVVALCFVGWGEVMQYVRAEVIAIRPQDYIESAVATGSRLGGLLLRHVLPNLLPALIAMAALEMGAVLMMLGELGFLGVFIGGGAYTELSIAGLGAFHYSDVPEWGALLANIRIFARSYPWTAIYPTLAFFVAILGFNLFGEGVRRLVQDVGIGINQLVNKWTLGVAAGLVLIGGWVQTNTGSMAFYRQQAAVFDGESARAFAEVLTEPRFENRQPGTEGHDQAAQWIAEQFEALGLQPAGGRGGFFQSKRRTSLVIEGEPELTLNGRPLRFDSDFAIIPTLEMNAGTGSGEVVVLMAGELEQRFDMSSWRRSIPPEELAPVADGNHVALVLSEHQLDIWDDYPFQAGLVVTDDPTKFGRFYTPSAHGGERHLDAWGDHFSPNRTALPLSPIFYISRELAEEILKPAGTSMEALERQERGLGLNEVVYLATGAQVTASIKGETRIEDEVSNVIGYLPGVDIGAVQGHGLNSQMIMVTAQYDGPGADMFGVDYPGANDNASGIGVMLELLRSWQETGYQPKRTFLFVAYANEGMEYGKQPRLEPDPSEFLEAKAGFANAYHLEAILNLRGLGGGSGDGLMISTGGSLHLVEIFSDAANEAGISLERQDIPLDYRTIWLDEGNTLWREGVDEAPNVSLWWEGYQDLAHTTADTIENVHADNLSSAGRTISLALLMMGREVIY